MKVDIWKSYRGTLYATTVGGIWEHAGKTDQLIEVAVEATENLITGLVNVGDGKKYSSALILLG